MKRTPLLFIIPFAIGCSGSVSLGVKTPTIKFSTPAPAPVVAPPPVEEVEAAPVVKEPPKNLEIDKDVIRLKKGIKIKFATNKAALDKSSNEIIDEVASVLTQNEKIRVRVEGHTDNVGVPDQNLTLSDARASAVKDYLVAKGIAADRLESKGCGQAVPIADNKTADGKAENRRVEFVILRKKRVAEPCQLIKPGDDQPGKDGGAPAKP
jgi:outer membrane protein OmpA-like peptidoglycan-associated protein